MGYSAKIFKRKKMKYIKIKYYNSPYYKALPVFSDTPRKRDLGLWAIITLGTILIGSMLVEWVINAKYFVV